MVKTTVKSYRKKDGTKVKSHDRKISSTKKIPERATKGKEPTFSTIKGRGFPPVIHRSNKVWFLRRFETNSKVDAFKYAKKAKGMHSDHEYMVLERSEVPIGERISGGKYKIYGRIKPPSNQWQTVINSAQWFKLSQHSKYTNAKGQRFVKVMTGSGTSLIPVKMKKSR